MDIEQEAKQIAFQILPDRLARMARSLHYSRSLRKYDMSSEPDLQACRSIVKPGQTVIDVGANIGVYTRFLSEFVGPEGRVVALEPLPETFSYLSRNVRALRLENVELSNMAASDHDGDLDRMSVPKYSKGGANLYEAKLSLDGSIAVRTTKLDSLFPHLSPAFIKCDVEGHEVACIKGATAMIGRCRPIWMVEVSHEETFDVLSSFGYSPHYYEEGKFRVRGAGRDKANCFFFPRSSTNGLAI